MSGVSSVGWDTSQPADTESLGLANQRTYSLKTSLRQGLDAEHLWPSNGGVAGQHRAGALRTFVDVQSNVSSSGTLGRLLQTSDTSRLFGVGSGGTSYFGGAALLAVGSFPGTLPQRHYWAVEVGNDTTTAASGTTVIVFPNSGFSGVPYLFVEPSVSTVGLYYIQVLPGNGIASSTTNALVQADTPIGGGVNGGISGAVAFQWLSIGSRVL